MHGKTFATFAFLGNVNLVAVGLIIFTGIHRLPHKGVLTLPNSTLWGTQRNELGSMTTVLHTEKLVPGGRPPHATCSLIRSSVTAFF